MKDTNMKLLCGN